MRSTLAVIAGVTLGVTAMIAHHRYAGALLWWLFTRGDAR